MSQNNKTLPEETPSDINNCVVQKREPGVAECMTGVDCPWAERAIGKTRLCKHPAVDKIASVNKRSHRGKNPDHFA